MRSALLLSIVLAAMVIPAITSRDPDPRRGLARMMVLILVYNAVYLAYITMLHPVLFVPHWP